MSAAVRTDIETFAFWEQDRAARMAAFKWLRDNEPVSWHPPAESLLLPPELNVNGFWALTKHADIQEASRSGVFRSGQGIFMEDMPLDVLASAMSFLAMDPPGHDELRGIVQKAFSPGRMRSMEDWIRAHAHDVVAAIAPRGQADLVKDLGKPLPGLIYAHYIGVDSTELRDRVVQAADQLGSWNDPEYTATMAPAEVFLSAAQTLSTIALELAEQRRKQPGDDMVTWLVEAEFEGHRMEDSDIASFFVMLSGAANDTTGHAIDVFADPEQLDLSRTSNRHLAFGGGGVHFCLGAALGRQLLKAALREVYTQLPDLRLGAPDEGFSNLFNHMRHLPATWTPTQP
jgi:cytochrome P450